MHKFSDREITFYATLLFCCSFILHFLVVLFPAPITVGNDSIFDRIQLALLIMLPIIMSANVLRLVFIQLNKGKGLRPAITLVLAKSLLVSFLFSALILWVSVFIPHFSATISLPDYDANFSAQLNSRVQDLLNKTIENGFHDIYSVGRKVDKVCFLVNNTVVAKRNGIEAYSFELPNTYVRYDFCTKPKYGKIYLRFDNAGDKVRVSLAS